ncbi:hypothetical protein K440DRAFT_628535 [Wilcoxina mikolae CBS 423.85]|nr:hypothetical protein K440DRAFT_628535 [Wilcoxina mikolae CBS 423.85]
MDYTDLPLESFLWWIAFFFHAIAIFQRSGIVCDYNREGYVDAILSRCRHNGAVLECWGRQIFDRMGSSASPEKEGRMTADV